jgi:hypothetical protein
MPSIATGANYFGQLLPDEAKSLGFTPNDYTIMPFDGGFSGGAAQVTALRDFNAQLVATFGWSSSVAYAHEGFSGNANDPRAFAGRSHQDWSPAGQETVRSRSPPARTARRCY